MFDFVMAQVVARSRLPGGSNIREFHWAPSVGSRLRAAALLTGALGWQGAMCAQAPVAPTPPSTVTQTVLDDARKQIVAGEFDRSAKLLQSYVATDPGSSAGHKLLAYCYLRLNDPKRSLEEYTRAAAIERPTPEDLENVAKDYVLLGDDTAGEHWMLVAVQMNDRDPEAWYGLGRVRYTLQRFQEAADCFRHSLALLPRSVKAENNLGLSYEGLNRTDDAIAAYRQAIQWQEGDPHPSEQPLLNLGIVLVHQGNLDEAQKLLAGAVSIAPKDARAREELGHLYLLREQPVAAQAQLEAAIALEPNKAPLHFLLGKAYHLQGLEAKAKAEFALSSSLSGYRSTPEK